ncbi:glucose-6-phosphate dehydrogenase assembly protein OpcA, partial [Deinococcus pimensis]|uniref:glucose-6-phosphate dehydrogenase assembly protein OpcA n=1 Tax=Deinococcus pimensis TaxID=309888 RepID=UPI0005EB0660
MPQTLNPVGPLRTDVRGAQRALDDVWSRTQVEARAYTGNIVALTEEKHLPRVLGALDTLGGRYAGRQIVGVMDGDETVQMDVSLVPQRGLYVERLVLDANSEQLQGAILPLLRPATMNHVWWASDEEPEGALLAELAELADQVIADTLGLNIPADRRYALADLGWARASGWREATAQLFDVPEAAARLRSVERVTVSYAGVKDRPARLFAGWLASRLGWTDLSRVTLRADAASPREPGDLCGVELAGEGLLFRLSAREGQVVHSVSRYGDVAR